MAYFKNLSRGIKTTAKGLSLTLKHLFQARNSKYSHDIQNPNYFKRKTGNVTLEYPHEKLQIPEIGRYQLELEMEDCIVCDKCAKVCPVNCIDIEPIKSAELIRTTSDGSPVRLHAGVFDIDMAKCCFCGLCTTVCPTECLTMNSEYDYSVFDLKDLNFEFSLLTEKEAQEKKDLYEIYLKEKQSIVKPIENTPKLEEPKVFKPGFIPKPIIKKVEEVDSPPVVKSSFQPKFRPLKVEEVKPDEVNDKPNSLAIKPTFVPKLKPPLNTKEEVLNKKPTFVPKLKPQIESDLSGTKKEEIVPEKPKFVPKLKPKI